MAETNVISLPIEVSLWIVRQNKQMLYNKGRTVVITMIAKKREICNFCNFR